MSKLHSYWQKENIASTKNIYFHPWAASFSLFFHQRGRRGEAEKCTAASSGLSKPLVLSIWLDCKNVSLFFNQWKLNYPDSWGTLEYINIFWQAWLRSPPASSRPPACHPPSVHNIQLLFTSLFLFLFPTICLFLSLCLIYKLSKVCFG